MRSATRPDERGHVALNRRRFLVVAGSVAGSAILAACGGGTATTTPKPATTIAPTAGTAPTASAGSSVATTGAAPTAAGSAPAASTSAVSSAASSTRPAGSTTSAATTSGTTAANASASGTGAVGTRPAGSAVTTGSVTSGTTTASGSASAGAGGQTLVIEATEYAFKTLGSIPAGVTTVQLKNLGKENHEAQFVRLNAGVTLDQLVAALQQAGNGPPPDIFSFEGGPAEMAPNKTSEVVLNFTAGQYALLCFVSAPDGQPHVAKGMILPITVNAATGSAAALPAGKGTITLGAANGLDLPATLPAGKSQYRVANQGAGPHALLLGSIPADKTIDDVNAELAKQDAGPPPWFMASGGMDGLKANGSGVVTLDLASGKYVAVDIPYGPDMPTARIFTVS